MYDVSLSFAYFVHGEHKESHLFATMTGPPTIGEPTSDFLGFFGFGSGNTDGGFVSPYLRGSKLAMMDSTQSWQDKARWTIEIINEIKEQYYVSALSIKHALRYLGLIHDVPHLSRIILEQYLKPDDSNLPVADLLVCCGVCPEGGKFFGIGLTSSHKPKEKGHLWYREVDVGSYKHFNWEYSTPVGTWDQCRSHINTMQKHHFTLSDIDTQNSMLQRLSNEVGDILTSVI